MDLFIFSSTLLSTLALSALRLSFICLSNAWASAFKNSGSSERISETFRAFDCSSDNFVTSTFGGSATATSGSSCLSRAFSRTSETIPFASGRVSHMEPKVNAAATEVTTSIAIQAFLFIVTL